jgi:2-polyprenyl-6-methoxyphenol hydroxylase-like FAD-dependent oxidoreductase
LAPLDDPYTLIEPVEQGWWYSAPIPKGKQIAMFMTDLDLYQVGKRGSETYWNECLGKARHTHARIQQLHPISSPRVYLAHSHQVVDLGVSDWLPVGDAMQGVDPLSGQGVYNALHMAEKAAQAIKAYFDAEPGAWSNYLAQISKTFGLYLDTRQSYYGKETRWPASDFWRRRTALASILDLDRSNSIAWRGDDGIRFSDSDHPKSPVDLPS